VTDAARRISRARDSSDFRFPAPRPPLRFPRGSHFFPRLTSAGRAVRTWDWDAPFCGPNQGAGRKTARTLPVMCTTGSDKGGPEMKRRLLTVSASFLPYSAFLGAEWSPRSPSRWPRVFSTPRLKRAPTSVVIATERR
jgi:hypothetical protein